MSQSKYKNILVNVFVLLLIIGIGLFAIDFFKNSDSLEEPTTQIPIPPAGDITIRGTIGCLPHRDTTGPQTLECAFGLRDEQGRYFGLRDTDPTYQNISGVAHNVLVEVQGIFTLENDIRYQSIGVIDVQDIFPAEQVSSNIWQNI